MKRYGLRDDQFARIETLLPGRPGAVGRNSELGNRLFVEAVIWKFHSGHDLLGFGVETLPLGIARPEIGGRWECVASQVRSMAPLTAVRSWNTKPSPFISHVFVYGSYILPEPAFSDRGGDRVDVMYSLIVSAKMNNIDPQAWLADVLAPSPSTLFKGSTNCCPGIGRTSNGKSIKPLEAKRPTCGPHRMLTSAPAGCWV